MNTSSKHLHFEKLADLADDRLAEDERTPALSHLSSCSTCAQSFQRLRNLMGLMKSDISADAPRDVIAYAVNLFQRRSPSESRSLLRRIVASLSFDSLNLAPAFGVRSGQATSRQLVYSAEENDIDLRLTLQNDKWVVAGQVLGSDCAGGEVTLDGISGSAAAALNELCEFSLPAVAPGNYLLRVRLADVEVEVPELQLN